VFGNNFLSDKLKFVIGREMIEEVFIEVLSLDIRYFYSNKFDNRFYGLYIF
jgi:hypothetical protein